MKIVKHTFVFLKWLLIFLVISLATLVTFLSFEKGKRTLVNLINTHLTSKSYAIELKSLSSFFPLTLSVDYVDLIEGGKPWLHLQDIDLEIKIGSFFLTKTLDATLSGKEVSLTDLPTDVVEEIANKAVVYEEIMDDSALVRLASIVQGIQEMFSILDLKIDLHRFHVGENVIGQNIDFVLDGIILKYDENKDSLFAKLPLSTRSFGSNLTLLIKAEGSFQDFGISFDLKTPTFHYDSLDLQNIALQGRMTGLPSKGQGRLEIGFSYGKNKGTLNVASVTIRDQILSLKNISLKGLLSSIQGDVTYNFKTDEISAAVKGNSRDLTPLSSLLSLGESPFSGTSYFEGRLKMNGPEGDSAQLKVQGKNLTGKSFSIATLNADLFASDFLTIPTVKCNIGLRDLKSNDVLLDTLTLRAQLEKGKGPLTLKGKGKALTLEMASDLIFEKDHQKITLKKLEALYNKQPFKLEKPFSIDFSGTETVVSPATLKIVNFPFTFQGKKQGEMLDFSLKGKADLGPLSQLFLYTGDIVKGLLFVDFTIGGTLDNLDYEGSIDLKKGYYENVTYGTKLHNLSFKAQAKNGLITLKNVKARDGYGGYLRLNGSYDLLKKVFDFKADTVNMRFAYTDQLKITAREGHLAVKGPFNNVIASGSLKMGDVSYNVTAAFADGVAELNVIDPTKPQRNLIVESKKKRKKSPDDFRLTFDFNIEIPPVVRVYGLGLESVWEGGIKVTQSLEDILMVGEITLKEGELDFLGQTIEIDEGLLTFDGQEDNIPYLALQASLEKDNFKAIVTLNGRATKPTFSLSSEPSLPQEEILSQLLFGSRSSKLSPLSALKLAKVAAELSGASSGGSFSDLMKDHMGKEEVSVEGAEDKKEAIFKAKDNLSDKVRVHLDQGVTPTDSKVVVEVEVTPKITISTEAGAAKSSESIGVNYNWDY